MTREIFLTVIWENCEKKIGHDLVHVPGSGSLIENFDGKILLQKRSDLGIWDMPGGSPETGEDVVEQAVRETYEETGLRAINPVPFGFASHPETQIIHYPNGDVCHFHDLLFFLQPSTKENSS